MNIIFYDDFNMPELENTIPERPTLTQRRTVGGNLPKINAFEKPMEKPMEHPMRLQSIRREVSMDGPSGGRSNPVGQDDAKGAGSAKIVIWVVIVVALAVASYFTLKNLLRGPSDTTGGPEPTVVETTVDPLAALVSGNILDDVEATGISPDTAFSNKAQTIGTVSTGTFSIDKVEVQKYTTFTRFTFEVSALTGQEALPATNAAYSVASDQITLSFNNTTTKPDITLDKDIMVNANAVDSFNHSATSTPTADVYVINLSTATTYVLHVLAGDIPTIVLDVKEVTPPVQTDEPAVTVLPSNVVAPTTTVKVTVTPTTVAAGDSVLDNAYSKTDQLLQNGLVNNSADLGPTFKWTDFATVFEFRKPIILGDGSLYPKVTASLVDSTLVVEIFNLKVKNATSSINFTNSKVVTKLDATRSGNSVKYVFTLTAQKDYRISFDQNAKELLIQIKH